MTIKHSKYKNTGVLFELLIRQITSDTLDGKDSPVKTLLKKYFVKTEGVSVTKPKKMIFFKQGKV